MNGHQTGNNVCVFLHHNFCICMVIELTSWEVDLVLTSWEVDFVGVDLVGGHLFQSHSQATPSQNPNLNPMFNEIAV